MDFKRISRITFDESSLEINFSQHFFTDLEEIPNNLSVVGHEGDGDLYCLILKNNKTGDIIEYECRDDFNEYPPKHYKSLWHYLIFINLFYNTDEASQQTRSFEESRKRSKRSMG